MNNKVKWTESLKPSSHYDVIQDCKLFSCPAVYIIMLDNSYSNFKMWSKLQKLSNGHGVEMLPNYTPLQ
jgi:hypothetical protein